MWARCRKQTASPGSIRARSIDTSARVTPRALASSRTSGSAIKQRSFRPSFAAADLFTPESAMLVSVTTNAPGHRPHPGHDAFRKAQILREGEVRRRVNHPLDDGRDFFFEREL